MNSKRKKFLKIWEVLTILWEKCWFFFQVYGYFKVSNTIYNSRMPEINFLILKKILKISEKFWMFERKKKKIFEENVTNCLRKNFHQKDDRQYHLVINCHVWSCMVTNNFSVGHLWWSQSILPTINDCDPQGHKTRCQRWSEVVAHHVVAFMSLHWE